MKKIAVQRLAVLIDADNIEIEARKTYNCRVNYDALFRAMNGREVVRALYYRPRACPLQLQTFLENHLGIEVKVLPKNVDTWLAIDAVTLAEKVDTIALVGGDADYQPLVRYLQSRGCKVEIWSWPETTAGALRIAADEFRALDERVLLPITETLWSCSPCEAAEVAA
jgi:uncharacterized LabA/DUF88 family protein